MDSLVQDLEAVKMENCVEVKKPATTIDKLCDKCLVSIFRHLPVVDLIQNERVCKRWRDVSLMAWAARPNKKLNMKPLFSPSFTVDMTNHVIHSVLKRCGPFLNALNINFADIAHTEDTLTIVATYCPMLRILHLGNMNVSAASMKALAESSKEIEDLVLDRVTGDFENELAQLIGNNKNLEKLSVYLNEAFTGTCLSSIESECFQRLRVKLCDQFDLRHLSSSRKLTKTLRVLTLVACKPVSFLDSISNYRMMNLTHLELIICYEKALTDRELIRISRDCQLLQKINLVIGYYITQKGLDAILNLPLLESLRFMKNGYRYELYGKRQRRTPRLKRFELINFGPTDVYILNLVELSPNLEHLIVRHSGLTIDAQLLEALTKAIGARENDIKLQLAWDDLLIEFVGKTFQILKE